MTSARLLPPVVVAPHPHEKHQREMGIPVYKPVVVMFDANPETLKGIRYKQKMYEQSRKAWREQHPSRDYAKKAWE